MAESSKPRRPRATVERLKLPQVLSITMNGVRV